MEPEHYSRDIVLRCRCLLQELRPVVRRGLRCDQDFGGPLNTILLLALATPMIVLPIERLLKPTTPNSEPVADDRELDHGLAGEVAEVLGPSNSFGSAPFAVPGHWSYVPGYQPFNIADTWPEELVDLLDTREAHAAAHEAPATRILTVLRNALAHGGITYLDARGRQSGGLVKMFAFAGAKTRDRQLVGLNVLRIREDDFYAFLMAWADWISRPAIRDFINKTNIAA